jgi:hypothetical protein
MVLTKENLAKASERIQELRGRIVNKAIDVEAMVNAILNLYFAKKEKQNEFMHKVLDDEYFSFGLKIKILRKINIRLERGLIEKIERIKNIRNEFAHKILGVIPKEGPLSISFNISEENPKNIEELYQDFSKLIEEVIPELDRLFLKLVDEGKKVEESLKDK